MAIVYALVLVGSLPKVFGQDWVETYGTKPSSAFSGGTLDKDGNQLFVCRYRANYYLGCGKTWPSGAAGGLVSCKIPYYEKEYSMKPFQVLAVPPWEDYELQWSAKTYSRGGVPLNAVEAIPTIYVGRFRQNGYYLLGKVDSKNKAFFYTANGKEYFKLWGYEVLTRVPRPIQSYDILQVKYNFSQAIQTLSPAYITLAQTNVTNDSPYDTTSTLTMDITDTTTSQWSKMDTVEMHTGLKITVNAGIPVLGSVTGEWEEGISKTYSYSSGKSFTSSVTASHQISVNLPAYSDVRVSMIAKHAYVNVSYTATLKVLFRSGDAAVIKDVKGFYSDVHYTPFETSIETTPSANRPSPTPGTPRVLPVLTIVLSVGLFAVTVICLWALTVYCFRRAKAKGYTRYI